MGACDATYEPIYHPNTYLTHIKTHPYHNTHTPPFSPHQAEIITEYRAKCALAQLRRTAPRFAAVLREEGAEVGV